MGAELQPQNPSPSPPPTSTTARLAGDEPRVAPSPGEGLPWLLSLRWVRAGPGSVLLGVAVERSHSAGRATLVGLDGQGP